MTEAEAFEWAMMAEANGITSFTIYISFTFGYLASAYLVGSKLSVPQVLIASALYVFAAISAVLNLLTDLDYVAKAWSNAPELNPEGMLYDPNTWKLYLGILLTSGILASLYFMWSIRKGK